MVVKHYNVHVRDKSGATSEWHVQAVAEWQVYDLMNPYIAHAEATVVSVVQIQQRGAELVEDDR